MVAMSFPAALLNQLDRTLVAAMRATPRGRIDISAPGMGIGVPALIGLGDIGSPSTSMVCMMLFGPGFGFFDAQGRGCFAHTFFAATIEDGPRAFGSERPGDGEADYRR